jgi:hypothetical protein
MAKPKKVTARKGGPNDDESFPVLHHISTVNTERWKYQVVLHVEGLPDLVTLTPPSAARFTALVALLTSGHAVRYWPAGGKVGIHTAEARRRPRARKRQGR